MENGLIRLTSESDIKDIRTDNVYTEVICKTKNEKFFIETE